MSKTQYKIFVTGERDNSYNVDGFEWEGNQLRWIKSGSRLIAAHRVRLFKVDGKDPKGLPLLKRVTDFSSIKL